jgi:predicted nucleotidyltransferase
VAWSIARRAAHLLREEFGATRVIAFGSLVHNAWFGSRSDIDLAVEGIPAEAFWRAWCALDRLDPAVNIDLIAIEAASDSLRDEIVHQGVAL